MVITRIALDTNMLLAITQFKVDVFSQLKEMFGRIELVVPHQVIQELKKLKEESKARKKEVVIALNLMDKNNVKVVLSKQKNADDALVELSENEYWIATNDKELKKRIGEKVVFLRKKKFLVKGSEW